MEHSDICASRAYMKDCEVLDEAQTLQYAKVAVCMAVFDSEDRLLITRRNKRMKHFPGAWVLPGGHVEIREGLEIAGLRELFEETGLEIKEVGDEYFYNGHKLSTPEPFYAFESCSPNKLGSKYPPASHHLIVFFKVKLE
jgi:8-oxo-dGTP pyrophosphatase MutT (NUDIX family)